MANQRWRLPTDAELAAQVRSASARTRERLKREPHAARAWYDRARDLVSIELTNGSYFAFPPRLAQGLRGGSAEQLAEVEVTPMGDLHWERLDADMSVFALLQGTFGNKAWMRELARTGGRSRSPAKVRAARANGRKGGRPRKRSAKVGRMAREHL